MLVVAAAVNALVGCAGAKPSDLLTQTDAVEAAPIVENDPVSGTADNPTTTDTPIVPNVEPTGRAMIAIYDYVRTTRDHVYSADPNLKMFGYNAPKRPSFYVLPMAGPDNIVLRHCDAAIIDIIGPPHYLTTGTCDVGTGVALGAVATKKDTIAGCNDVDVDVRGEKKVFGWSSTSYEQGKCK